MSKPINSIKIGLEVLAQRSTRRHPTGCRVGLLSNDSSLNSDFCASVEVLHRLPGVRLEALFGPQHGVSSDVQDNMVETGHAESKKYGIPVWSLYSDVRKPKPEMLDGLDVIIVDLQDIGARVYTFIWSLRLLMEACGKAGVKLLVLDRPNPLGGVEIEGNILSPEFFSFVGLESIPMRHGLTMGELALYFKHNRNIDCEIDVVPMEGWKRSMLWSDTARPWINPSPNMPSFDSCLAYPGTVLLEGTTASEGRGTTRPFEVLGAPWIDADLLAQELSKSSLPGVRFRPMTFLPTFQKWTGKTCCGVQIHTTDPRSFKPFRTGLEILRQLWRLFHERGFAWKEPPYEYETEKLPINLLIGDERVRKGVEANAAAVELEELWKEDLAQWNEERKRLFLY